MPLPVIAVGVLTLAGMYKVFETATRLSMKPKENTSSSVTIEACVTCQGVFLEHGELKDILNGPES